MDITNVPSPNFSRGRNGYRPEAIVIHIMDGTLAGTDSWFKNSQSRVSAHYGIGTNGEIHQYVQEADTAWQAGRVKEPTWTLIKPAGNGVYVNPNYYTIGIEHEGNENSDWTEAMYIATSDLVAAISKRWNIPIDRQHIIGHREIYSLKTCPGLKVDLVRIVELSRQKAGLTGAAPKIVLAVGNAVTITNLNLRKHLPSTTAPVARVVVRGTKISYTAYTDNGEQVKNTSRWYQTQDGLWFWGGGVEEEKEII